MITNHHLEETLTLDPRELANLNAEMAGEPHPYLSDEEVAAMEADEALAYAPDNTLSEAEVNDLCVRVAVEDAIAEVTRERILADAFAAIDRIERVSKRAAADHYRKCKKLSIGRARAAREGDLRPI